MTIYPLDPQHPLTVWLGPLRLTCRDLVTRQDFLDRAGALGFAEAWLDDLPGLGLAAGPGGHGLGGVCCVRVFPVPPAGRWGGVILLTPRQRERLTAKLLGGQEPGRYEGPLAGQRCRGQVRLTSLAGYRLEDGAFHLATFLFEHPPVCPGDQGGGP